MFEIVIGCFIAGVFWITLWFYYIFISVSLVMTKDMCNSKNLPVINNASASMFFKEFDNVSWVRNKNYPNSFFYDITYYYNRNYIHASIYIVNGKGYLFHNPIEYFRVVNGLNKRRNRYQFKN